LLTHPRLWLHAGIEQHLALACRGGDLLHRWLAVAAVFGLLGVTLGAFGAHGLRARLEPEQLASWQTAVQYHLLHSVALLALALFTVQSGRPVGLQAWLFTLGIALFSGSIYVLVLGGPRWLGPVTPLGGLCLIGGWLSLLLLARS
jgi:uncharacterized membrane protein YgdD (TMEM256/DUF423 family)